MEKKTKLINITPCTVSESSAYSSMTPSLSKGIRVEMQFSRCLRSAGFLTWAPSELFYMLLFHYSLSKRKTEKKIKMQS